MYYFIKFMKVIRKSRRKEKHVRHTMLYSYSFKARKIQAYMQAMAISKL